MKNILTLILIHFSLFSFAQVSFGVKGGLNLSNISIKNPLGDFLKEENVKSSIGFHGGVYLQVHLSDKLSLIPELQYTKRGYTYDENNPLPKSRVNLNYLELPVFLSYFPIEWLGIDLGPNVAYIVAATIKADGSSRSVSSAYDKIDFSISGGVRIRINEKISAIGRYNYGLTTVDEIKFRDERNVFIGSMKTYHRNMQLGMSYKLR
jgi:hypothetical protein